MIGRYPFEIALCKCENPPVEVPLELALIPAPRHVKKLREIAEHSGVPMEKLAEALLKEMAQAVKRGLMIKYEL